MHLQSRRAVVWTSTAALAIVTSLIASPKEALAAAQLDQQQLTIDNSVGGLVIGGSSLQKLGQIVKPSISGDLVRVDLTAACAGSADLNIEIRDVAAGGAPGATVMGATTVLGSTIPAFFPAPVSLRQFTLKNPVSVTAGVPFAIVLTSTGTTVADGCGIFQGPVGDSYARGDLYFDALPNAPGWLRNCDFANASCDIPFRTWVEPAKDPIVFVSAVGGGSIDTIAPDGTGQAGVVGLAGERPRWSPTRDRIAFHNETINADRELYVANADGSGQVRLTSRLGLDQEASWAPDGRRIAYTRQDPVTFALDVWALDATTGAGQTNLTNDPSGSAQSPAWSPDGTKIAFVSARTGTFQLYVMNADGTGQTQIVTDAYNHLAPAWSPDGTRIAYHRRQLVGTSSEIFVTDATGAGTPTQLTAAGGMNDSPTWSPDGTKIAFSSDRSGTHRLYTMDASGANQVAITSGFGFQPDWSRRVSRTFGGTVSAGGTVSSGGVATPSAQLQAAVTTPNAGDVSIQIAPAPSSGAPSGYTFLGLQATISAPAATAGNPLIIEFTIDRSLVPPGGAGAIQVQRNGVVVAACAPGSTASPDPCFTVTTLPDGDVQITIRTSQASIWQFLLPDNQPPSCDAATATPNLLWPPNGSFRLVTIGGVTDPDGDNVTVRIDRVSQDEPVLSPGSGNTSPDAKRDARAGHVWVRAERAGTGDGRVYSISFTAIDEHGSSCSGMAKVGVPHDRHTLPMETTGVHVDSFTE